MFIAKFTRHSMDLLDILDCLIEGIDFVEHWRVCLCVGPTLCAAARLHESFPGARWPWLLSLPTVVSAIGVGIRWEWEARRGIDRLTQPADQSPTVAAGYNLNADPPPDAPRRRPPLRQRPERYELAGPRVAMVASSNASGKRLPPREAARTFALPTFETLCPERPATNAERPPSE